MPAGRKPAPEQHRMMARELYAKDLNLSEITRRLNAAGFRNCKGRPYIQASIRCMLQFDGAYKPVGGHRRKSTGGCVCAIDDPGHRKLQAAGHHHLRAIA
jgi:hypothetical protein